MRRWLIGLVAGLACAAGLSAYAVTAGGFPSRPWLQALGVGIAPGSTPGEILTAGPFVEQSPYDVQLALQQTGATGNAAIVYEQFEDSTGARLGFVGKANSSNGDIYVESDTGGVDLQASGGSVTLTGNYAFILGAPETYGHFQASSSGCPLDTGQDYANIVGCTRNAAGEYTVTFAKAFPVKPVCEATYGPAAAGPVWDMISAYSASTTSAEMIEVNPSGTVGDYGYFNLVCK